MAEIDPCTFSIKRRIDLPGHPCPISLALTGERLWVGYGCSARSRAASSLSTWRRPPPAPTPRGTIDGGTHDHSEVRDLVLTSDGTRVISAFDTPYRFDTWDTTTLSRTGHYGRHHEAFPTGLAISPDDTHVAGGRDGNTDVTVYDAATGAPVFSEDAPAGRFVTGGLAFSGTSLYALLRGAGDRLRLRRIEDVTPAPAPPA
ncbi:WD40 repeat domain-containing protein [Nonomuraea gerenzanensis]|uniref:Uncharacterized protein n=1 Tax=Nonomuraea gerenzanensis TaxID=93944 RepID=A0A1M4EMB2_9ACTN|nr:WD40 repeat domain-containing protein [Nonomuraea gerenzanensis]UBU11494.1 WD40 repeat domain-containing protein [Nonomuraea gerenzanensis]SBO99981.1 hypothetical protein BN4615_P9497 [Nonomuraea gerenzanensis]